MIPYTCNFLIKLPLLIGRMADNPPPPPYIAAMMQQFELNRQLNKSLVNHLERNDARQDPGLISLQEFERLSPSVFRNSTNPMESDDCRRHIMFEMGPASA